MASTLTTQSLWSKCLSGFSLTIFFASIPYFPIKKHIKPECLNIHASATVISYLWLHKEWSWERVGLMDVIMTRWQEGGQSSDRGPITGHKLHETSFVMTLARATEQWVGRHPGMSQKTGRWRTSNVGCSAQARFRQHWCLAICIWFGWVWQILYRYQTLTVSDNKIQISILILRRGALPSQTQQWLLQARLNVGCAQT